MKGDLRHETYYIRTGAVRGSQLISSQSIDKNTLSTSRHMHAAKWGSVYLYTIYFLFLDVVCIFGGVPGFRFNIYDMLHY